MVSVLLLLIIAGAVSSAVLLGMAVRNLATLVALCMDALS